MCKSRFVSFHGPVRMLVSAAVGALALSSSASAGWWEPCPPSIVPEFENRIPGVTADSVSDATIWDPDGPGPRQPSLVISSPPRMFEGGRWVDICPEYTSAGTRIAAVGAELYASGRFFRNTTPSESFTGLARWDGSNWVRLIVHSFGADELTSIGGSLYRIGAATTPDGNAIRSLQRFDGNAWSTVPGQPPGSIQSFSKQPDELGRHAVVLRETSGNNSRWSAVALFDGTTWTPIGDQMPNGAEHAHVLQGDVYAAGDMFLLEPGSSTNGSCVAKWNGQSWQPVGRLPQLPIRSVHGLSDDGTRLVLTGSFVVPDPADEAATIRGSAVFDGASWRALGFGFMQGHEGPNTPYASGLPVWVNLIRSNGSLFAYGRIRQSEEPLLGIARWNGAAWELPGLGFNAAIRAFASDTNKLVAVGDFTMTPDGRAGGVARYDGTHWHALGSGGAGISGFSSKRRARGEAVVLDGAHGITVGGWFTHAGGHPAANIARFDGTRWNPLADGFDSGVLALSLYQGNLIAGGKFTHTGETPMRHVARWNGVAWQSMNGGADQPVSALLDTPYGLIAGGDFTTIGGTAARGVAAWDGAQWTTLSEGINGSVRALAMFEGDLYAAADMAPGSSSTAPVWSWDGLGWRSVRLGGNGSVPIALGSVGETLYVAESWYDPERTGWIDSKLSPMYNEVTWSSDTWFTGRSFVSTLGIMALAEFRGEAHFGGGFHHLTAGYQGANGKGPAFWVRARVYVRPVLDEDSLRERTVWRGERVEITARAEHALPRGYTWTRGNSSSVIATGPTLVLDPVEWADGGLFYVRASNPCWSDERAVLISLYPDFIEDGVVDVRDLRFFISRMNTTVPAGSPGDLYGDGQITVSELSHVLRHFGRRRE
ncbi:MAG: hypothetical protein ACKVZJ_09985 [Phycisphaerales bacterium]